MRQIVAAGVDQDFGLEQASIEIVDLDEIETKSVSIHELPDQCVVRRGAGDDHWIVPGQEKEIQAVPAPTKQDVGAGGIAGLDHRDVLPHCVTQLSHKLARLADLEAGLKWSSHSHDLAIDGFLALLAE